MKKIKLFGALVVLSTIFLFNGCSKDDSKNNVNNNNDNCTNLATAYSNALTAYYTEPTEQNCNAVAESATNFYNGCDVYGNVTKEELEDFIASLDCSGN